MDLVGGRIIAEHDTAGRALAADLIGAHLAAGGTALAATHEPILAGAAQASVA